MFFLGCLSVCVSVCVSVCLCVCLSAHARVHARVRVRVRVRVCIYDCVCVVRPCPYLSFHLVFECSCVVTPPPFHQRPAGTPDRSVASSQQRGSALAPPLMFSPLFEPERQGDEASHRDDGYASVVTGVNLNSVLENPRVSDRLLQLHPLLVLDVFRCACCVVVVQCQPQERSTLLEEMWSAEPEYVVPPCPFPLYANPPSRGDFQPYLRKLRKALNRAGVARSTVAWSLRPATRRAVDDAARAAALAAMAPPSAATIVPAVFFRPDFDLRDPATFEEVIGCRRAGLQQRLSHYLDTVDDEISRHVRRRAGELPLGLLLWLANPPSTRNGVCFRFSWPRSCPCSR